MKRFVEVFTDEYIPLLERQILFSGLSAEDISLFIQHSNPFFENIQKGQTFQLPNEHMRMIGLVFKGNIQIFSVGYDGSRTILKSIREGETSGILYSTLDYYNSVIELTADTDAFFLLIDPNSIFIVEKSLAVIQHNILVNLLASQRQVFIDISQHMVILSQRSIRDKVLKYLQITSNRVHSYSFKIIFSREELASYLAVDRASLSRTLGELKKEGIIDFKKNKFKILDSRYFMY